jgi:predicted AAA+ superfamily ATPase
LNYIPYLKGELLGIFDDFIDLAFSDKHPTIVKFSKKALIEKILIGGYPNVQSIESEMRETWFDNYITTILKREITELAKIEGIIEFPQLLRLLATRAGSILNVSELSRASMLVNTTLRRYLALLQTVFMIYFLPSWSINLGTRLVKSPKVYLIDSGLLSHLLGINQDRLLIDTALMGSLLENFVFIELKKQATWSKKRVNFYYFRTLDGTEVDILLEDKAGTIVGLEIKASETVTPSDFKGLRYLQEKYKKRFLKGIVLYTGSEMVPFGKNLFAWPISALWSKSA